MGSKVLDQRSALTLSEVVACFDSNAPTRDRELQENGDAAYRALQYHIVRLLRCTFDGKAGLKVLDAGCGVGMLTRYMADRGLGVTAVDPSRLSIRFAQRRNRDCDVRVSSLEALAETERGQFDAVVANQVLQCVPDLTAFLAGAWRVLRPGGALIISLPDPETYLAGRSDVARFVAHEDRPYAIRFRIRGGAFHPSKYWYFQRSLFTYLNALGGVGFRLVRAEQPERVGHGRERDTVFLVAVASLTPSIETESDSRRGGGRREDSALRKIFS